MLSKRIENLEAAANATDNRSGLSIETHREVLRIVREDDTTVEMLRTAAWLECRGKDVEAAKELNRQADVRIRNAIAQQLGEDVARRVFQET